MAHAGQREPHIVIPSQCQRISLIWNQVSRATKKTEHQMRNSRLQPQSEAEYIQDEVFFCTCQPSLALCCIISKCGSASCEREQGLHWSLSLPLWFMLSRKWWGTDLYFQIMGQESIRRHFPRSSVCGWTETRVWHSKLKEKMRPSFCNAEYSFSLHRELINNFIYQAYK